MKIKIEVEQDLEEDEIIIRCRELNPEIQKIEHSIRQISQKVNIVFFKDNIEYYLPLNTILFFETAEKGIDAHTQDNVYQIKRKLYELEEVLPNQFVRVSKSTILNVNHIYSIDRNLTSSSIIRFNQTYKQVYVSRNYYQKLKQRLEERRNYET